MNQKSNHRTDGKRLSFFRLFGVLLALVFGVGFLGSQVEAISSADLLKTFKNFVKELPAVTTPPAAPLLNQGGEGSSPTNLGGVPVGGGGSLPKSTTVPLPPPSRIDTVFAPPIVSVTNDALTAMLLNLLSKKEFRDQLRGSRGEAGPQGPAGAKGDSVPMTLSSSTPVTSIQPSAPVTNPVVFMPVGITVPNPSVNFSGGTYASISNLTANNFTNSISNITTLNVSGNSVLTGTLAVTGTATVPTLTTGTSLTSPLILGSTAANGTITIEGNTATTGNTATNANIVFKTGDSAGTTAMTILNSGNIGIGDTSPDYLLELYDATTTPTLLSRR